MTTITVEQCDHEAAMFVAELREVAAQWSSFGQAGRAKWLIRSADFIETRLAAIERAVAEERLLREALSRASIRSYSHKQRDLNLEFENSDDLATIVVSVGVRSGDSLHGEGAA